MIDAVVSIFEHIDKKFANTKYYITYVKIFYWFKENKSIKWSEESG